MKKTALTLALALMASSFLVTGAKAGTCYWVCSEGRLVPIKQGICIMPIKPLTICRNADQIVDDLMQINAEPTIDDLLKVNGLSL